MNIKVQVSNPTILYQAIFLWCILLFTLGTQVIETLPMETQQTILNLNIVLAVGFIISRLVAKLKWLMPLLLRGLCFTSGAIVAVRHLAFIALLLVGTFYVTSEETAHFFHPGTVLLPKLSIEDEIYPEVRAFTISPDGRFIAAIGSQELVDSNFDLLVWSVEDELNDSVLPSSARGFITTQSNINEIIIRFSPNSEFIAIVIGKEVYILSLPQLETVTLLEMPLETRYSTGEWSINSSLFILGGSESILIWDLLNNHYYEMDSPFSNGTIYTTEDKFVYISYDGDPIDAIYQDETLNNILICELTLENCQLLNEVADIIIPLQGEPRFLTQTLIDSQIITSIWEDQDHRCCDFELVENMNLEGFLLGSNITNSKLILLSPDRQNTNVIDYETQATVMSGLPRIPRQNGFLFLSDEYLILVHEGLNLYKLGIPEPLDNIQFTNHPMWIDLEEFYVPEAFRLIGAENRIIVTLGDFAMLFEFEVPNR